MDEKFVLRLDGNEAEMIYLALNEKAKSLDSSPMAVFYKDLADRVRAHRVQFHIRSYADLAERHGLPKIDVTA